MSEGNKKNKRKIEHWELVSLLLMVYDFIAILVSYLAALWLRFDCRFDGIQKDYIQTYFRTAWIYAVFCIVVFWFLRLYKYRTDPSDYWNRTYRSNLFHWRDSLCGENAGFLLCIRYYHPVLPDIGS